MVEHKQLSKAEHEVLIRPNPAMPWRLIKKIYLAFAIFILIIALFLIALIYIEFFYKAVELDYHTTIGKGFLFKIGSLVFKDQLYQKFFFMICSLISLAILLLYLKKNLNDWMIIFYYILLSLVAYPLLQEYFDPLIFLMVIIFFKTKINFEYKPVYLLYVYFLIMNIFANSYYSII